MDAWPAHATQRLHVEQHLHWHRGSNSEWGTPGPFWRLPGLCKHTLGRLQMREQVAAAGLSSLHKQARAHGQLPPNPTRHRGLPWVTDCERLQVRELVAAAGLDVAALKRVRVGGYRLPRELGIGQARYRSSTDARYHIMCMSWLRCSSCEPANKASKESTFT